MPGGKLLSIKLSYGSKIEKIQILGDFFLYPENKITEIEKALLDTPITESEDDVAARVKKAVNDNNIELVGITPEAIASVIKMAVVQRPGG